MREIARGISGRLLVGPDVAAELGPWSVTLADGGMGDDSWTCSSTARSQNPYLLAHGSAFKLRLDMGASAWCWRNVQVAIGDGRAIVVKGTGRPEER